ncbi:MAG: methylated-DNA--[protein]-cysteine S-methyltransferase [Deltaproteobacteria bacterium]|nr:methylated-DNA--[protein]-cysteine S-methyltransferase [Deltaproteobacteria bacterium]MBW2071641.1 methylated-DNA--[protein]-cysteine S-methyltransferase [Deltaproteobacteria bacterium]
MRRANNIADKQIVTPLYYDYYESPIGLLEVGGTAEAITSLSFVQSPRPAYDSHPAVREAVRQLDEYFYHRRQDFHLKIHMDGTGFQKKVWRQLLEVPYGRLASYRDIAVAIGRPRAVRAVGAANGKNPIALVVPCHRIIGSNGKLIGYGSGLWRKEWLLRHEGSI